MKIKLSKITELVGGSCVGDESVEISGVCGINEAKSGDITFVAHKKYLKNLEESKASAFILNCDLDVNRPYIKVVNPYLAFAKLLEVFFPSTLNETKKVDALAFVGEGSSIGENVSVLPNAYIGNNVTVGDNTIVFPGVFIGDNSKVGKNTKIFANVSLYGGTVVHDNVIIHSGAVIGADGFGFTKDEKGRYYKIPQVGRVIIEDDVEVGANVCIDRATMGDTVIKRGTKLDNLVQIAHNVSVGEDSVIAAQSGVSGSSNIGKNVTLAGQVGVADHVNIADNTILIAQTGVGRSIKQPGAYSGTPAIEHNSWRRMQVSLPKVPDLIKKVRGLEKRLAELEKK